MLRILVVDQEFLVAMEVERALGEALDCEVQVATPRNYPMELERQPFDVVVIDVRLVGAGDGEASRRLRANGASIVFLTLSEENKNRPEGWADTPLVSKLFNDHQLIEAVRNAARL